MRKFIINFIIIFFIGMIGGIFADQIFWPYFIERPLFNQYRLERAPIYVTETKEIYIEENDLLQDSIEKVKNSVIALKSTSPKGLILEGSAMTLTNDGLIVTLAELVPQGYSYSFYINGKEIPYQFLKRDTNLNLALIKLEGDNFSTLGFKNKENLKIGEKVFLIGSLKEGDTVTKMVNEGIIKKLDNEYIHTNITEDISLKGSILFNKFGEVIGLNLVDKNKEILSIPANTIKDFTGF